MDFDSPAEHDILRDSVRRFFEEELPESRIRELERSRSWCFAELKMYKAGDLGKDKLTMRGVGQIYGATIGYPQIVGTPEQVADQMEAI